MRIPALREARTDTMTDQVVAVLMAADLILLVATCWLGKDALVGMAAVLASSATGAIAGLLFGIPRRKSLAQPDDRNGGQTGQQVLISANTSLEDVSDWLTKTIIGVGLVSWASVLATLDRAGAQVGTAIFGAGALALPGGVSILLASFSFAGLSAYLWFSRHLPSEFDKAYREINRAAAQGLVQQRSTVAPSTTAAGSQGPTDEFDAFVEPHGPATGQPKSGDEQAGPDGVHPADISNRLAAVVREKYAHMRRAPVRVDDWAKGMFGGKSSVANAFGHRSLAATVKRGGADFYSVELTVTASPVPETEAVFFLHNTFENTTPAVSFDTNGTASLTLSAYGAFTVGVLTDDGSTELELDLAELSDAPRKFRQS